MNPIGRLSRDLRDMRWGQVAVELLLLVLGILIALAIDDWMQDRRDAQTERQNLEGIVRDLDRDLVILEEFGDYHESQTADGIMAYRALRSEPDVKDKEGVAQALSRLMSRRTLRLSHPTYSNLVGSGNIRLLRNDGLRDRIIGLYDASDLQPGGFRRMRPSGRYSSARSGNGHTSASRLSARRATSLEK